MENDKSYEIESITITKAENGYKARFSKKLTEKARTDREKQARGPKGLSSPMLEYHKSEEYVAGSAEAILKLVSNELKEYESGAADDKDDQKETNHENYQAGGLGFR